MKTRHIILSLSLALFLIAPIAHAESNTTTTTAIKSALSSIKSTADLEALIIRLMKQLEEVKVQNKTLKSRIGDMVQGKAPEHRYTSTDDKKEGKAKIMITAPKVRASFDMSEDEAIEVAWNAKNIPDDAQVVVELDTIHITGGSGVGGGTWVGEIPEGDSTGTYEWDISGDDRISPGKYRVRVLVRECPSDGCDSGEGGKVFARSPWKPIVVTDSSEEEDTGDYAPYKATLNGHIIDSARQISEEMAEERCKKEYNDYDQYQFEGGDVLKCYWDGELFETVDEWKG
jgi:hypothetical protein